MIITDLEMASYVMNILHWISSVILNIACVCVFGTVPVVRCVNVPSAGSLGSDMPMAFLMPYTLLTSPGVT